MSVAGWRSANHGVCSRSFEEEQAFITRVDPNLFEICKEFVPNMNVPVKFYVNEALAPLLFDELRQHCGASSGGGFLPAVKQMANVAALPGIVKHSIALPDCHSGYGFAIGNVAAFDMDDPEAVVSPGGVGFDINCGVRLIRTNLMEEDVEPVKEELTQVRRGRQWGGAGGGDSRGLWCVGGRGVWASCGLACVYVCVCRMAYTMTNSGLLSTTAYTRLLYGTTSMSIYPLCTLPYARVVAFQPHPCGCRIEGHHPRRRREHRSRP